MSNILLPILRWQLYNKNAKREKIKHSSQTKKYLSSTNIFSSKSIIIRSISISIEIVYWTMVWSNPVKLTVQNFSDEIHWSVQTVPDESTAFFWSHCPPQVSHLDNNVFNTRSIDGMNICIQLLLICQLILNVFFTLITISDKWGRK